MSRKLNLGQFRGPWVPAPGKSSNPITEGLGLSSSKLKLENKGFILPLSHPTVNASSSSSQNSLKAKQKSVIDLNKVRSTRVKYISGNSVNKPIKQNKQYIKDGKLVIPRKPTLKSRLKHGARRNSSNYKLQSKDSLVDVTACLQAKRAEVMKIWEKHLLQNDPSLLSLVEKANRLALEAAEEVETLRRAIQDFQKKEDGLTDTDCLVLNEMRANVLTKVREFEETDNHLHEVIARKSLSRTSVISSLSKTSQTMADKISDHEPRPSTSKSNSKDMIFIKEKAPTFPFASQSESEDYEERKEVKIISKTNSHENIQVKAIPASKSTSHEHLGGLRQSNEEILIIPPLEDVSLSRSQSCGNLGFTGKTDATTTTHQQPTTPRSVRFKETIYKSDSETMLQDNLTSQSTTNSSNDELYQSKITRLQRKLMGTEQEVDELKSEIERIESDANFRVRMLQNTVQDRFDSLAVIPEYLQMVELRINETTQVKTKLQQDLDEKEKLLQGERENTAKLKKENDELREKLRTADNTKELLTFKNYELEKSNGQLRKEIDDMAKKYTDMAAILRETDSFPSPRSHHQSNSSNQNWEVQKLKLQCSDLKDKLSQSKRIIHSIRKSKEKMALGLNQKIEELMVALQEAQHHKRILGDQIRFLKKSYHDLFPNPSDLFGGIYPDKMSFKSKSTNRHHLHARKVPVNEPKVEAKVSWQTGKLGGVGAGDAHDEEDFNLKLDDELDFGYQKRSMTNIKDSETYDIVTGSENDDEDTN